MTIAWTESRVLTGNEAVAEGVCLARVQTIAAYPITPQTQIVERLAEMVARGELAARFVNVESEHSAMAACFAAAAVGARTFTATSSQGLALMHEMLHWTAGARLPIVMANVNRALAPPWSVWADHTDALSQRDTGWMQVYAESNQEVLDSILLAYAVSERVLLPTMVNLDGFLLSHTAEPVEVYAGHRVDLFLPDFEAPYRLRPGEPRAFGGLADPGRYLEFRLRLQQAMARAAGVIEEEGARFAVAFGRGYGLLHAEMMEDAETVLMVVGSMATTARAAIAQLRREGRRVGLLRVRVMRPFPFGAIRRALRGARRVAVLDRNLSPGHHGILHAEVKSALFSEPARPSVSGYVLGLGGRDVRPEDIAGIVADVERREGGEDLIWWGTGAPPSEIPVPAERREALA
ncbi:MAG: pyruvate ferredoxin oxidoreductase [Armatimonadetes bacterium]|nr:pyruvate ferredoxin oxidoreductase [Armatimonadota bacterium]